MNILITGAGGFIRSASNIGKVQNLENVIRGFALAAKFNDRIKLNIIGDGSNLEDLKNIVKEEDIANVHFWGQKTVKGNAEVVCRQRCFNNISNR